MENGADIAFKDTYLGNYPCNGLYSGGQVPLGVASKNELHTIVEVCLNDVTRNFN